MANNRAISKAAFFKQIGYEPHPGQVEFHRSDARFRVAVCGRRYGKSHMAGKDLEPKLFLPNKMFWIVGPVYSLAEKEFRVIWQDLIINRKLGQDKTIKRAYSPKQGNMWIEFPWGTKLECKSADHSENLVGEGLDHVIMSEAAKHQLDTWERFIRPALADRRGSADFVTTPEGFNWLYDLWMLGHDPSVPEYASWSFPSWNNPSVYPGGEGDPEIKLLRRTMTPESFAQEIGADFGSFVGKIYPEWDISKHVKEIKFNPLWPNYIAFDFGYTNPLAAIEFQISPDDRVYIWREHYKSFTRVEDHCEQLKAREQPFGYHLDLAFGDAADPEAAATISQKLVPCYAMPEAKVNWREGIDLVRSFMEREEKEDEFGGPIYFPAIFVDFSCINTIREFNNYKSSNPPNGRNAPEKSLAQDDHAMDALRYALVHIYKLGATYHLSDVMDLNLEATRSSGEQYGGYDVEGASGYFTKSGQEF